MDLAQSVCFLFIILVCFRAILLVEKKETEMALNRQTADLCGFSSTAPTSVPIRPRRRIWPASERLY
jgi:hypothetical protein